MGLFRPDRHRRDGEDRFLLLKQAVFIAGAAVAVVGMATERDWLILVAVAILAAGVILRFLR